jgi:hypothetical protein
VSRRFISPDCIGIFGVKVQFSLHILDSIGKAFAMSVNIEDDDSALPDALRALERRMLDERPERVVLKDASEAALAGALVAAKLGITVQATPAASDASTANGRVIAQLAASYTQPA